MADMLEFPGLLMRERSVAWNISGNLVSPGQTANGLNPVVRTDGGGFWRAELNSIALNTADQVRCWRAISAYLDGGSRVMVVPICDKRHFPAPVVNNVRLTSYDSIPHSDDSLFSDGSGYYQKVVVAAVVADASLRATTMQVEFTYGGPLRGGELFSVYHATYGWRLYQVRSVDEDGNVTFRPPLREAVEAGDSVEFDRPRCVMRLTSADAANLSLDLRKFGQPSISFIEAMPPFS